MTLAYCRLDEGQSGHEAGRKLLTQLYEEAVGGAMPEICTGLRGKPYFADSSWHFSISHTPRHAFCVLSRNNIAIDAEEADRPVNLKLAQKILSPMELSQFESAADQQKALLTFWVLKEAAGKLTGQGINGFPNHTEFTLDDPRVTEIDGCIVAITGE